jgi:hypothetical protein
VNAVRAKPGVRAQLVRVVVRCHRESIACAARVAIRALRPAQAGRRPLAQPAS